MVLCTQLAFIPRLGATAGDGEVGHQRWAEGEVDLRPGGSGVPIGRETRAGLVHL